MAFLAGHHRSLPRASEANMPPKQRMAKTAKAASKLFKKSG